jgi:hypothetical protein
VCGCGERGPDAWRIADERAHETLDECGLQPQLLGVGDVLPGASAARTEVWTAGPDPERGRLEDFEERGDRTAVVEAHTHALPRDGEWNDDGLPSGDGDTVAFRIQLPDVEVDDGGHGNEPVRVLFVPFAIFVSLPI